MAVLDAAMPRLNGVDAASAIVTPTGRTTAPMLGTPGDDTWIRRSLRPASTTVDT